MSPKLDESITLTTSLFNCSEVKPNFINDCCFGEDFANWLHDRLAKIADLNFELSTVVQEDYGWGFFASRGEDDFWVALSCVSDGPHDPLAQWLIFAVYDTGLNIFKRLFHKPDSTAFDELKARIRETIESNSKITIEKDWRKA